MEYHLATIPLRKVQRRIIFIEDHIPIGRQTYHIWSFKDDVLDENWELLLLVMMFYVFVKRPNNNKT